MDYLFTPWRYAYIASAEKLPGCIFCGILRQTPEHDRSNHVVFRGRECFLILNAFPYTSGHVMIVPYDHLDELQKLPSSAAHELMEMTQKMERVLHAVYQPEGINVGMNIGKAAGAGVAGHVHMHVLPRWTADSNFMSAVGETRVVPEALEVTYERVREAWLKL
jgi:ATP adenylyltransferase